MNSSAHYASKQDGRNAVSQFLSFVLLATELPTIGALLVCASAITYRSFCFGSYYHNGELEDRHAMLATLKESVSRDRYEGMVLDAVLAAESGAEILDAMMIAVRDTVCPAVAAVDERRLTGIISRDSTAIHELELRPGRTPLTRSQLRQFAATKVRDQHGLQDLRRTVDSLRGLLAGRCTSRGMFKSCG